jgi:hypothetical protein
VEIAQNTDTVLVEYFTGKMVPAFLNSYHASSLRWVLFDQYMVQNEDELAKKYEKLMFSDVRDVAFQADPFKYLAANKSVVFQEGGDGVPISQCSWNSGWIKGCFGESILTAVQDRNIVCSGVSIFSFWQGRDYVRMMSSILSGESDLSVNFPRCERNGVDQGVHNVIVHLGLIKGLEIKTERQFPVVNIQSSPSFNVPDASLAMLQLQFFDEIRNVVDTAPFAVIHQYDRSNTVSIELAKKYVAWKSYDNLAGNWQEEAQCERYNTLIGPDILAGRCDTGSFRAFSPEQCCSVCNSMQDHESKSCSGFSFSDGVCYFKSCSRDGLPLNVRRDMKSAESSPNNWRHRSDLSSEAELASLKLTAFV